MKRVATKKKEEERLKTIDRIEQITLTIWWYFNL